MRRSRIFRFRRGSGTALAAALSIGPPAHAQAPPPPAGPAADSVTIVPGPEYGAGGFHRWLAGAGYRDLWTVPIRVEVADLGRLGGGLAPLRVGGGMNTRTLHVQGADGRRYVLRSVDKFVGQGLGEELQGTLYEAALQDQVSAFHPSGALVVAGLLEPFDVLHVEPRLLVIPDDPRLGEFREAFAGMLALFEERPDDPSGDTPAFAGARRIVGTDRLMERLAEDPRHRVHEREYLTARLIDLIVGDRDKSVNNWLWARFDRDDEVVWRPIPRDRDQAFIRLDGMLKDRLSLYEPRLVSFGSSPPRVTGITRSSWDMDRPFLARLERTAWDSVVAHVRSGLTDEVVERAVRRMPPEHYALVGPMMIDAIRARRDDLERTAERFYRIVARYADVFATDEDDVARIERLSDGSVRLRLMRAPTPGSDPRSDPGSPSEPGPYLDRTFRSDETRELRVYLLGGADRAVVRGSGPRRIHVRVIGGDGADVLADSSRSGWGKVSLYDGGERTRFVRGSASIGRYPVPRPKAWGELSSLPTDWGSRFEPFPLFTVRGDVGAVIGGGVAFQTQGFARYPYARRLTISATYSTAVERPRIEVNQRWNLRTGGRIGVSATWSGFEIIRFHGFGNDTPLGEPPDFFRVAHHQLVIAPSLTVTPSPRWRFTGGPLFKLADTDTTSQATFLSRTRPYGSGHFAQIGAEVGGSFDTRNRPVAASSGFLVTGRAALFPSAFDVERTFGELSGTAAVYLSPSESGNQVLALRAGGKKVWGPVPVHEAAFLGGPNDVRGLRKQRFAGDTSVFGNAEVRLRVGKVFLLFPTEVGVLGIADIGRVFLDGDSPGSWHWGAGGGVWLAPVARRHTISVVFAEGADFRGLYLRTGFMF